MLATLIKARREELRLSQGKLAKALKTTQATVSRWESNEARPRSDMLLALSDVLQLPAEHVIRAAAEA